MNVAYHAQQCFFFKRIIGKVTPKINYFGYVLKKNWIKRSKKTFSLIDALMLTRT